jgi:hypothetical protein
VVMTNVVCVDDGRRSTVVCHTVFSWRDRLREFVSWIVVIFPPREHHPTQVRTLLPPCVLLVPVPRALTCITRLQQSCLPEPHVVIR